MQRLNSEHVSHWIAKGHMKCYTEQSLLAMGKEAVVDLMASCGLQKDLCADAIPAEGWVKFAISKLMAVPLLVYVQVPVL